MIKRLADWLEKLSVTAWAVGLFQERITVLIIIGAVALAGSLVLTVYLERGGK